MKIKKHVLFILCCCTLCYQVSGTKFIEALPGETIVLKYKLSATYADWYGPWYDNTEIRYPTVINALDRYGENKTWNVTQYSSDANLRNSLPQKNRLHIAGQGSKGEFYLEIRNVSVDDAGLYLCKIHNLAAYQSLTTIMFIVHLKYIPDLLITFEPSMLIYERSSLRLCCLSNNNLPNVIIGWVNTKDCQQDMLHPSTACLHFVKTRRNDSGIYTCKAEYEGQTVTANITVNVLSNISLQENALSIKDVVIIVLFILIAVILVITRTYILFLKRRYRKRFIETINIRAEEDKSPDRAHYINITEVNNVLTTSQENHRQTDEAIDIDAENIGIVQMPEEQNSSLSNSYSDTTEYINSGYEHLFTTLVANNGEEDEHMYDVTKQNFATENILPSRSEPFVEIIEQYSSSDNVRRHFHANDGHENVKLKDLIANDNASYPSSFQSKKHEPEYINLPLKQ